MKSPIIPQIKELALRFGTLHEGYKGRCGGKCCGIVTDDLDRLLQEVRANHPDLEDFRVDDFEKSSIVYWPH